MLLLTIVVVAAAEPATGPPKTIADLKALEQRIRRTVAQVSASVVAVSGGSGVVISEDGYLLTVAHVDQRAGRPLVVVFPDGRRAKAVTLGNDFGADAGMAKISDPGPWPHAQMASSGDLRPGQWCLTLGYPITFEPGRAPVVRIGRVLANEKTVIITDCTIMGGDSGAPLFDLDGKVVAIGTKCDNSVAHNLHVPLDRYTAVWKRLAASEDFDSLAPKPVLGVAAAEGAKDVRLGTVDRGSGAELAGIKPGDLLLKVDGKEIHKFDDVSPIVQRHKPGDKVEVVLRRGKDTLKLQVTLGQSNAGDSP
ncbi:MAG: S1C family serine protease [Thermoguttaceae bacterium]